MLCCFGAIGVRELPEQPNLRYLPLAHQGLRDIVISKPAEKAQFHNPTFSLVNHCQSAERIVQGHEVSTALDPQYPLIDCHVLRASASFAVLTGAGEVHQDATHQARG